MCFLLYVFCVVVVAVLVYVLVLLLMFCFVDISIHVFLVDQIKTESNTARCLCNRSANTDRWQLDNNTIKVLIRHKCLTQALHSPDESHNV